MPCNDRPGPCIFEQAHLAWQAGDFEAFLALQHDDIEWTVNMDGISVPYASSAVGKQDLRWRLQHMMNTFAIEGFDVVALEHGPDCCRSTVQLNYIHRGTGEPLDVKVRFIGWQRDGLLVRVYESADSAYVTAYEKFNRYLDTDSGS